MAVALAFVVLLAVIYLVSGPLRHEPKRRPLREREARIADLLAAREAKYREIRDAQLDYRTGKLTDADYAAIDGTLRAEALTILDELEGLTEGTSGPGVLEQEDRVQEEQDGEDDGPAVQVPLDERASAERARTGAHAERP
jgi:hypothetical protein